TSSTIYTLSLHDALPISKEFSVYRTRYHRDGSTSQGWFPMNKDVGSLMHYQEQALACNRRYLDALAVVDDPAPAYLELRQLTERSEEHTSELQSRFDLVC